MILFAPTGHPGYLVTEDGRVWSEKSSRFLKPSKVGKYGHLHVTLSVDGNKISRYVHQLVARAFIGTPKPGEEVRHIDGNASNNHRSNLQWGTRQDNVEDMLEHGTERNQNTDKPNCKWGHPLSGDNLRIKIRKSRGGSIERQCRACQARLQREKRARSAR